MHIFDLVIILICFFTFHKTKYAYSAQSSTLYIYYIYIYIVLIYAIQLVWTEYPFIINVNNSCIILCKLFYALSINFTKSKFQWEKKPASNMHCPVSIILYVCKVIVSEKNHGSIQFTVAWWKFQFTNDSDVFIQPFFATYIIPFTLIKCVK